MAMMGVPRMGTVTIESAPPAGGKKVINIYVDANGKLVIVYET